VEHTCALLGKGSPWHGGSPLRTYQLPHLVMEQHRPCVLCSSQNQPRQSCSSSMLGRLCITDNTYKTFKPTTSDRPSQTKGPGAMPSQTKGTQPSPNCGPLRQGQHKPQKKQLATAGMPLRCPSSWSLLGLLQQQPVQPRIAVVEVPPVVVWYTACTTQQPEQRASHVRVFASLRLRMLAVNPHWLMQEA
jgi:hypothetical protein